MILESAMVVNCPEVKQFRDTAIDTSYWMNVFVEQFKQI